MGLKYVIHENHGNIIAKLFLNLSYDPGPHNIDWIFNLIR